MAGNPSHPRRPGLDTGLGYSCTCPLGMTPEIPDIWNKRCPASAGLKPDEVSQAPCQARGDDGVKAMLRNIDMTGSTAFGLKLRIAAVWRDREFVRAASINAPILPCNAGMRGVKARFHFLQRRIWRSGRSAAW